VGGSSSRGPVSPRRFGDGYMITVRTKSSLNVKEVVRFFNRNFPEAVLKVSSLRWHPLPAHASAGKQPSSPKGHLCGTCCGVTEGVWERGLGCHLPVPAGAAPHQGPVPAEVGPDLAGAGLQQDGASGGRAGHRGLLRQPDHAGQREAGDGAGGWVLVPQEGGCARGGCRAEALGRWDGRWSWGATGTAGGVEVLAGIPRSFLPHPPPGVCEFCQEAK